MEVITSRHNPQLVELNKLNDRKQREKTGLFRFDGIKLCADALRTRQPVTALYLREEDGEAVLHCVMEKAGVEVLLGVRVIALPESLFASLCEENAPEGVMTVCRMPPALHTKEAVPQEARHLLLLESVRDPSNLGAIVRSAAALGIDGVVLSRDCADLYNAKTVRASMGTLFTQPIYRTDDMPGTIRSLRNEGKRVFAAALNDRAKRLGEMPLLPGDCVVIGNEGHGLTAETIEACNESLYIPMTDRAESLNAAVAASLVLWELSKS